MKRLVLVSIAAIAIIILAGSGYVIGGDDSIEGGDGFVDMDDHLVHPCAASPPADFSQPDGETSDVIGWVDGHWYNQPLEIDASDGLTPEELEALSARTAARFEALRCLTLEEMPEVEVISREESLARFEERFAALDDDYRAFDNAKLATLLTVGHDEDSLEVRAAGRGASVGGSYNFVENRITIVTDDTDALPLDESILAHELGHAIQHQTFDLTRYNRTIHDIDKAKLGVIEGDVHLVQQWYDDRCEDGQWNEPCIIDDDDGSAEDDDDSPGVPNWSIYFMNAHPYSDGVAFVDSIYRSGGWDAVNDLYDAMPTGSHQLTYPDKYPGVDPVAVTIADSSEEQWSRIDPPNRPAYDVIGQGGVASMFMGATVEGAFLIELSDLLDTEEPSWFNYDHTVARGWHGDRFVAYQRDDGEIGSVWKMTWGETDSIAHFVVYYRSLIEFHGGERVTGYENVYGFDEDSGYDMVVGLSYSTTETLIITAPSVDELTAIHGEFEVIEHEDEDPHDGTDGENGNESTNGDDGVTDSHEQDDTELVDDPGDTDDPDSNGVSEDDVDSDVVIDEDDGEKQLTDDRTDGDTRNVSTDADVSTVDDDPIPAVGLLGSIALVVVIISIQVVRTHSAKTPRTGREK